MTPFRTLANGDRMPGIGHGTFGSDKYRPAEVAEAVFGAAEAGYRHFDCARVYGNEAEVGDALKRIQANGIKREDLWITSKVWNNRHDDVLGSCQESLADLGLDYLDLFLIHWPFPNHHEVGVDVNARDPHAVPFSRDRYLKTWQQMEALVDRGLVRHIGTSNMTISKLTSVLEGARIKPAANEMELHPHFQQPELFDFVVKSGIIPIGYSPIGSPSRPERDRTAADSVDIEDPVIVALASKYEVHPAVICVLWQIQRGSVPIPFSVKKGQYAGLLESVDKLSLTEGEMAAIAGIDKNCRLIKGQVFLWPGATDWHDLWQ